jgi:hypothetical protein
MPILLKAVGVLMLNSIKQKDLESHSCCHKKFSKAASIHNKGLLKAVEVDSFSQISSPGFFSCFQKPR